MSDTAELDYCMSYPTDYREPDGSLSVSVLSRSRDAAECEPGPSPLSIVRQRTCSVIPPPPNDECLDELVSLL